VLPTGETMPRPVMATLRRDNWAPAEQLGEVGNAAW
jgi:hypothetical protein